MSEFTFVEAPPPRTCGRNAIYAAFADALRDRPGEWAIWPKEFNAPNVAAATTANIKKGRLKNFPAGQFEAVTSGCTVYARYIGGQS